ncbi:uncharacterized protein LOC135489925 [Lineus longissimus]|uniref:uncharacterized protein LOC135489925 n=1 Tax=Lineus longissimus TaxID=88925 RepID=UPI00315C5B87
MPIAVAGKRLCVNPDYKSSLFTYVGSDCVKKFLEWLNEQIEEARIIDLHCSKDSLEHMSSRDWKKFVSQQHCEMCGIEFTIGVKKCIDHCHLQADRMRYVLSNLVELMKNKTSTIVDPESGMKQNQSAFPLLSEYVKGSSEMYDLLLRKGVFCYEYLDRPSKLQERQLPPVEAFFDSLKKQPISSEDYEHATKVWRTMNCKTLGDYLVVYLQTDVLLLADCFEKFRAMSMKHFQLDPVKYISAPHMTFDAMLKMTRVHIDLIEDLEQYLFVKKGIRGGVASIFQRRAHISVDDDDDVEEKGVFSGEADKKSGAQIFALDATNLYGYSLSQDLPHGNYRWIEVDDPNEFNVLSLSDDSTTGYILEVDLEYPTCLHDSHNDFPLAPEKLCICPSQWSPLMHVLARKLMDPSQIRSAATGEKLIPHLGPRTNYIVYLKNLLYYLQLGMTLSKVHRILAFDQSPWMKDFVSFCTEQRKAAANNPFESDFWKKAINSCYGKFLQDKTKHINMSLVSDKRKFLTKTSKPNFKSVTIYNRKLVGIQMKPRSILLDRPITAGMVCLETSKMKLYKMHYDFIKPLYGDRCHLLMTDTDSLLYFLEEYEGNVDEDFFANRRYFDLSNYPKDSPYFCETNKKVRGTFKREDACDPIVDFVGLRAKMYSTRHRSEAVTSKAKGLPRCVMQSIGFEQYEDALYMNTSSQAAPSTCNFKSIRSKNLKLYTLTQEKKALSPLDTKRWLCKDNIHTFAFGHYRIKNE